MTKTVVRQRPSGHATGETRGFALIITVALLALLVMVLISLATLTRIEAGVGENSIKLAQARQNAQLALDLALGELQRYAGPDTSITATAEISGVTNANKHWTGIWPSAGGTAQTWLVSGNENGAVDHDPTTASIENLTASSHALSGDIEVDDLPARVLVGPNTADDADAANFVIAPLVDLKGPVAGESGNKTVGRYAWWVGDEGVKASLALRDRVGEVDYGPYTSTGLRERLRQQVPMAHQGFRGTDGSGTPKEGFDPADATNAATLQNILSRSQLAFLNPASGTSLLTSVRRRFHDWTTVSSGVIASTNSDYPGLKMDLSQDPGQLGDAFVEWADYERYMEGFPSELAGAPAINGPDDFRRRYVMTAPASISPAPGEIVASVAPVVSDFVIQFLFLKIPDGTGTFDVAIRCRAHVELWNPYTSALVPPSPPSVLYLDVTGLPGFSVGTGGVTSGVESLQDRVNSLTGASGVMRLELPFDTGDPIPASDSSTWLPGRIFNWRTTNYNSTGSAPLPMRFASKALNQTKGWLLSPVESLGLPSGNLTVSGDAAALHLVLRGPDGVALAQYSGPIMPLTGGWSVDVLESADDSATSSAWCLAFGLRIPQPGSTGSPSQSVWMSPSGYCPTEVNMPPGGLIYHAPGVDSPVDSVYRGALRTDWDGSGGRPGLLLNRPTVNPGADVSNDTPVLELPRVPFMSLGALQHLHIAGAPGFAVGNSWGASISPPAIDGYAGGTIGSWFDRFFFSGSVPNGERRSGVDSRLDAEPADPMPFVHLRPLGDSGGMVTIGSIRSAGRYSSKHLLVGGAFNVNSTSIPAWEAVLRAVRPGGDLDLQVGGVDTATGNAEFVGGVSAYVSAGVVDSTQDDEDPGNRPSGFFRFSQTWQECFESITTGTTSGFNRTPYRQGFRGGDNGTGAAAGRDLSSDLIRDMAGRIVTKIRVHGPFGTMEDFVGVLPGGISSILESAIEECGANTGRPFMSGHFLTQADILTAIGPFLQCRSDTFLIRTYGETLNPVTQEVEARAWCEATVQRIPTRVDGGDITAGATGFGRRFVITSFRWLSPDDI